MFVNLVTCESTYLKINIEKHWTKMKHLKHFFLGLKMFVFIICFVFFILLMRDVWQKFSSGITNTGAQNLGKYYSVSSFSMKIK